MKKTEQVKSCFERIDTFCEEHNYSEETQKLLHKFMGNYLANRRTPTTIELDLKLDKLVELCGTDEILASKVITKAMEMGWASFYPIWSEHPKKSVDNIPTKPTSSNKRVRIEIIDEKF